MKYRMLSLQPPPHTTTVQIPVYAHLIPVYAHLIPVYASLLLGVIMFFVQVLK